MENASDALLMAFAVFVFIGAISLLFYQISMAKNTADIVFLYGDKTNFYTYENNDENAGKTVDKATVISTLYRVAKDKSESMGVIIRRYNI